MNELPARHNFEAGKRPAITIRGLKKAFGGATLYDGLDLDIPQGRFISVFGPNGCGKSTLINLISGLIPIDGGEIMFDGRDVKDVTIGYVFQNYRDALFPCWYAQPRCRVHRAFGCWPDCWAVPPVPPVSG